MTNCKIQGNINQLGTHSFLFDGYFVISKQTRTRNVIEFRKSIGEIWKGQEDPYFS